MKIKNLIFQKSYTYCPKVIKNLFQCLFNKAKRLKDEAKKCLDGFCVYGILPN